MACEETGLRAAAYSTFCTLWRQLIPQVTVMKPMSDLCWVCQQNSAAIMRAANTPEEEKSEVIEAHYYITTTIIPEPIDHKVCRKAFGVGHESQKLSEGPGNFRQRSREGVLHRQGHRSAPCCCLPPSCMQ